MEEMGDKPIKRVNKLITFSHNRWGEFKCYLYISILYMASLSLLLTEDLFETSKYPVYMCL